MMLLLLLFDYWYSSDLCVVTVLASRQVKFSLDSIISITFIWSILSLLPASSRIHATTSGDSSKHSPSCDALFAYWCSYFYLIEYWAPDVIFLPIHNWMILHLFLNLFGGLSFQGLCYLPFHLLYLHVHYYCCTSVLWYSVLWYIKSVKLCLTFYPMF